PTTPASAVPLAAGWPSWERSFSADSAWVCSPCAEGSWYHSGSGGLLGCERHLAARGVDADVELIEEVAAEKAVTARVRHLVGSDRHAAHARLTDLDRVHDDEVHPVAARDALHPTGGNRPRERDAGRSQGSRADQRPVGPRVYHELCRRRSVEPHVDHDRLSWRIPD